MPPTRRLKVLAIALTLIICTVLYLSNDSSSQEFYTRTVTALDKKETSDREVARKLQEVKDAAKAQEPMGVSLPHKPAHDGLFSAAAEAPTPAPEGGRSKAESEGAAGGDKSVAGRKTMKGGEAKDVVSGKETTDESPNAVDKQKAEDGDETSSKTSTVESEEDHQIETELNSILKKGPIIIFSKSYCPHSARAKKILLEKYTIVPAPYVVELDTHPLGRGLQDALEKSTGRRTVPNVLVSGRSIGGGDDIQALDDTGRLLEKVKGMAGKRIMEARLMEGK